MNDLHNELLRRSQAERDLRDTLARDGSLNDEYHPERETLHIENALWLKGMIDKVGLPGKSMVGEDGAEAAWSIIQNAISLPDLQREMLPLLQEAAGEGEFPLLYPAYLEDCIRFHEGRPLRYDIYSDWTDSGVLDILPIEDEASVDSLRLSIGLPPLEEARKNLLNTKEHPPKDIKQKKELYQNWRKKVGWM